MSVKTKMQLDMLLEEADVAISAILKDQDMGRLIRKSVSHSDTGLTLKIEVLYSNDAIDGKKYSQNDINFGLVSPGTILWAHYPDDGWYEVRILKARRTKYLFEWVDGNPSGNFIANFTQFRPSNPEK